MTVRQGATLTVGQGATMTVGQGATVTVGQGTDHNGQLKRNRLWVLLVSEKNFVLHAWVYVSVCTHLCVYVGVCTSVWEHVFAEDNVYVCVCE